MDRAKVIRRGALALLCAAALVVTLAALILASDRGRQAFLDLIAQTTASDDFRLEMHDLRLGETWTLAHFSVSDATGPWLEITNLRLRPRLLELLRGRVALEHVGIGRLILDRLPRSNESSGQSSWPSLSVNAIDAKDIHIGPSVVGQEARLSLHGALILDSDRTQARLRVTRLDRVDDALELNGLLDTRAGQLDLNLLLREAPGGLAHAALGLNGTDGISVHASGQGPLSAWPITFSTHVSDAALLEGNATITLDESMGFSLGATLFPGPAWAALTGLPREDISISGTGTWQDSKLHVSSLDLTSPAADLKAQATWDVEAYVMEARITGQGRNLAAWMPHGVTSGPARIEANLRADPSGLRGQGEVRLRDWILFGHAAPEAQLALHLDKPVDTRSWKAQARMNVQTPTLPEGLRDWNATASITGSAAFLALDDLALDSSGLKLAANGTLDADLALHLSSRLRIASIAPTSRAAPLSVLLETRIAGHFDRPARQFKAEVNMTASEIAGLPREIGQLLGQDSQMRGHLRITPDHVRIDEATMRGRTQAELRGDFAFATNRFSGEFKASMPELNISTLQVAPGSVLTGSAAGSPASFELDLQTKAPRITGAGLTITALDARAKITGLPDRPKASVAATALAGEEPLGLNLRAAVMPETIRLSDCVATLPQTSLRLAGDLDPRDLVLTGNAEFLSTDLRALGRALDTELTGSLTLRAGLARDQGLQIARLDGQGRNLTLDRLAINRLALRGNLASLQQPGATDLNLEMKNATVAGLRADRVEARLNGTGQALGLAIKLDHGASKTAVAIRSRLAADLSSLEVLTLDGTLQDQALRLESPLRVTMTGDQTSWEKSALRLGPARLSSQGSVAPARVVVSAELTELDSALLQPFFPLLHTGRIAASLDIQGTPDAPDARLTAKARQLALAAEGMGQIPNLDATAEIRVRKDQLQAKATLTSPNRIDVEADISGPVRAALLSLNFPPGQPLSGRIRGRTELFLLPRLLHLDDQTLDGQCDVDLRIGGTWDAPLLTGSARVRDARYENFRTGTVLEALGLDARARGSALDLNATATDGGHGRISARGSIDLWNRRYVSDLFLDACQLLRLDLVHSTATGALRLQGSAQKATLDGNLILDPTTIQLPLSTPPDLARIEIQEINANPTNSDTTPRPVAFITDLNLRVGIPARMHVQRRDLDSEWSGQLHVGGSQDRPVLSGEMTLLRGKLEFLDRIFELTKGVLTLDGETPPNPYLDVLGETQILDTLVQVRLNGPARNFQLTLTSVPMLPQDELLSMILFGRSQRQISPLQAVRLAQAAAELTGISTVPDVLGAFKSRLGLQEVDVSKDDDDNTAIGIGGYVGEKYYVRTQRSVSGKDSTKVEVQLTPKISVETEIGSDSRQGGGVNWKHDY